MIRREFAGAVVTVCVAVIRSANCPITDALQCIFSPLLRARHAPNLVRPVGSRYWIHRVGLYQVQRYALARGSSSAAMVSWKAMLCACRRHDGTGSRCVRMPGNRGASWTAQAAWLRWRGEAAQCQAIVKLFVRVFYRRRRRTSLLESRPAACRSLLSALWLRSLYSKCYTFDSPSDL